MGDAMKAIRRIEKEREEETEVKSSDEETETMAEVERKRKGKGIARSEPSKKEKKMEKAPASKPFVQQNIFELRFNLPFFIFKGIAKSNKHRRLPYVMPLTLVFQAMGVNLSKEKKFSNPIPIKEIFKANDESDIPISKLKERSSKIDEGESSKKKEKMKLKMSDFVKISKANLEMMNEIKEMSGLSLNILEKSHELQKGIMAKKNAKMDMLINRLDRQEWFMKKMAQLLFSESFGKFGDLEATHRVLLVLAMQRLLESEVKISEVEEEEEKEHVETAKKEKEKSKLAEVEEVKKNDEKEEIAEEKSEAEQGQEKEKSGESSSSHTKSNSSSENGKSESKNGSRQEEEKEDDGNKEEEQS
ncbi:beta-mannosyltransferase 4-like [Hevea brasiliensis]|uniref:beta-mannosyltransferase 4-like n=1 Tax=Hevea brasiliensis TaxID=3981 RepID=UPI0025CC96DC|nr:beta-mannosyltransferase 4-like [Hevea brasiliensis]